MQKIDSYVCYGEIYFFEKNNQINELECISIIPFSSKMNLVFVTKVKIKVKGVRM